MTDISDSPATLDALFAALALDGEDALAKLAIADFYESAGDDSAAECMRWAARNEKRPRFHGVKRLWFWISMAFQTNLELRSELPQPVFNGLSDGASGRVSVRWSTPQDAWNALIAAWGKARAAGWQQEERP